MSVRIAKCSLVAMVGVFSLLVGTDNLLDYGTNFAYVQHVLTMDTLRVPSVLAWRAINNPALHHWVYALVIVVELVAGLLCMVGALRLASAHGDSALRFNAAKRIAILGLLTGFTLWFFGFMVIGGEWFQMWQSPTWNGQQAAFRFAGCLGLILLFVAQRDEELI